MPKQPSDSPAEILSLTIEVDDYDSPEYIWGNFLLDLDTNQQGGLWYLQHGILHLEPYGWTPRQFPVEEGPYLEVLPNVVHFLTLMIYSNLYTRRPLNETQH